MKKQSTTLLLLFFSLHCLAQLSQPAFLALTNSTENALGVDSAKNVPNKRNFVLFSVGVGGGDYPFGGFGLTLSHKIKATGKTYIGFSANYHGDISGPNRSGSYVDIVQNFPLMLDLRHEFRRSASGKSSTLLFFDAGYVVSISDNKTDQNGEYELQNGWGFNPGISFKFNLFPNAGLMLDLGWIHHTSRLEWLPPSEMVGKRIYNLAIGRLHVFF